MPTLKKPQTQKAKQQEEEKPKSLSLASLFENAEESGGSVKPGRYEALITGVSDRDTDKGLSVSFECTIVNHESMTGRKAFLNYGITKADPDNEGEFLPSGGIGFLKRDMKFFGVDDFVPADKDEMIEAMQKIADDEVWINIEIKKKGEYTNTFLQDVNEDQDEKPERPAY